MFCFNVPLINGLSAKKKKKMLNVLVLGHSFIKHSRQLCEDDRTPHQWEDPTNCKGKLHVQFHGYPGGRVDTLTHAI